MKIKELNSLSKKEKKDKLTELRAELMKLNSQRAVGSIPKNPSQIKNIKKTIAQILTIQHAAENQSAPKQQTKEAQTAKA